MPLRRKKFLVFSVVKALWGHRAQKYFFLYFSFYQKIFIQPLSEIIFEYIKFWRGRSKPSLPVVDAEQQVVRERLSKVQEQNTAAASSPLQSRNIFTYNPGYTIIPAYNIMHYSARQRFESLDMSWVAPPPRSKTKIFLVILYSFKIVFFCKQRRAEFFMRRSEHLYKLFFFSIWASK